MSQDNQMNSRVGGTRMGKYVYSSKTKGNPNNNRDVDDNNISQNLIYDGIVKVVNNFWTQVVVETLLLLSIILPDSWILGNIQESQDSILAAILLLIFTIFICLIYVLCIAIDGYFLHYLFWADVLSTLSLFFEISWFSGSFMPKNPYAYDHIIDQCGVRTLYLVLRFCRLARAMQIIRRILRLNTVLSHAKDSLYTNHAAMGAVRRLADRLVCMLTERVSLLLLGVALVIPYLSYDTLNHDIDLSVTDFLSTIIALNITKTAEITNRGKAMVYDVNHRYSQKDLRIAYFSLYTASQSVMSVTPSHEYIRQDAIVAYTQRAGGYTAYVEVDTGAYRRATAGYNLILYLLLLLCFGLFTSSCFRMVETLVIVPLDRMVSLLKHAAEVVLHGFSKNQAEDISINSDEPDTASPFDTENAADYLENLVDKLERLLKQANTDDVIAQQTKEVDVDTRQYIETFTKQRRNSLNSSSPDPRVNALKSPTMFSERHPSPQILKAREMGINSWEFHVLDFQFDDALVSVESMFQNFRLFSTFNIEMATLAVFLQRLQSRYNKNPYHNFLHAVDVCHGVYRILTLTHLHHVLPPLEVLSLLIAALGHDVGHPAVNNAFLVNTQHELALRYNDMSPLENMHASLLFEILLGEGGTANLLKTLDATQRTDARKVIVTTILSTDMVHHFQLVSKTQIFQEKNGDEMRRFCLRRSDNAMSLMNPETRMFVLEITLHMSDVSNVCKPFKIGGKWSELIIDEMFNQGDLERERGMAVSPFMDRMTMDRALLQMNFIEFVVTPLMIPLVSAFPKLLDFGNNISANFNTYSDLRRTNITQNAVKNGSKSSIVSQLPVSIADDLQMVEDRVKAYQDKLKFMEEVRRVCEDPLLLDVTTLGQPPGTHGAPGDSSSSERASTDRRRESIVEREREKRRESVAKKEWTTLKQTVVRGSVRISKPGSNSKIFISTATPEHKIQEE